MGDDENAPEAVTVLKPEGTPKVNGIRIKKERSISSTPNPSKPNSRSSSVSPEAGNKGHDGAPIFENGAVSKLSRPSQKAASGRNGLVLFDHLASVTDESCATFQVISDCLYGSRHMGASDHDAWDCECAEDWHDDQNHACGEDSDCINRATKLECIDSECNCGAACQNQRFQRKQYADVSVIRTEKKGFGLRANTDLQPNDFVFEYIGEVINEATFRSRMLRYDKEGIKHFYFMSLTRTEFVDATKKGNLGRFCNHSCNPNCYVDKWVVGEKLRMGIFAGRKIAAGEELVFNYNVDRYGADPQPCYCGESNCTGVIGGKTQTERATKLPLATIEALGIDDGDGWDTAVAKKPRKKKPNEDDEEYVNSVQPRDLEVDGVTKVMATLMQCKEKWIGVKLLKRLQSADDEHVRHRVVRMHGYQILKTTLNTFKDDTNVVLQVLDILYKLPRLTRNKITDANIEGAVEPLTSSDHEEVRSEAKRLLEEWSKLETAYRIPRKKLDPSVPTPAAASNSYEEERRNMDREEAKRDPFANIVIPTGPRGHAPQRGPASLGHFNGQRPPRKLPSNLPEGWFVTTEPKTGRYYFYDTKGNTTWKRPTGPALDVPRASTKAQQDAKTLQDIIASIEKEPKPRPSASQTPQQANTPKPEEKKEKWRSLPVEKQMKIYENTLFPHIKYVMDKFHHKLPRDDLKKLAKDISKKLVASDYKHNRVEDPTSITAKQEAKVKRHVKDFFDRALVKYREYEKRKKAARTARKEGNAVGDPQVSELASTGTPTKLEEVVMSDVDDEGTPSPSSARKRKREDDEESVGDTPSETPSVKRIKDEDSEVPTPPPPPPPPESAVDTPLTEEERSMREQEEALMRENEEAQRLEEEQQALKENDAKGLDTTTLNGENFDANTSVKVNGTGAHGSELEVDGENAGAAKAKTRQREVLSH
ncbi:hypothetical protein GQ53DRAFT_807928 [Thozetella sp. PMI_491]|nr:hypothetical protein GQ53DRAFT_807928 [Thozetella sp. PMI_491]